MLKRLIAAVALAASFSVGALAFASTPASAGRPTVWPNGLVGVGFSPQQEQLVMLNAYAYGPVTGAYYTCTELNETTLYHIFGDCDWMIGANHAYSFPILQWWAHYNDGVEFYWNATTNAYVEYVAFSD